MMSKRLCLGSAALCLGLWMSATSVESVTRPEAFLGYEVGDRFTPHHRVVAYLEQVAAESDRVELVRYGTSYEGRPLVALLISSPDNLARRETIKQSIARLADPRTLSRRDAEKLADDVPVVVWLSFNIHGDEASGTEAALLTAHTLAEAEDPSTREDLERAVVILDPCLNPDGRDRYVNWINGVVGSAPDPLPAAREHHQPWPGGRYNHYLFDLNRDWAWLTQQESRDRARFYLEWRPQVHVDLHEMWADATYFFFPPEKPVHPLFPPEVMKWSRIFGQGNADAFDRRGWRYYTAESFDLYYPGYGDTWPSFHGATGMTYEQAGHGFAGVALQRAAGDTLTLAERAHHHSVAALATVHTAAEHRRERLLDFYSFFDPARRRGPAAFLFPPGDDPPRTAELMHLLMLHGAEVYQSRNRIRGSGLRAFRGSVPAELPAGTYVVPLDQPLHRFLQAVLEPEADIPDTLFYDVSAWSLPLAFGLESYVSEKKIGGSLERLTEAPVTRGRVHHPDAGYAFLIPWERNGAARAAALLQARRVPVHFAGQPFHAAGRAFPPGSLVVFAADAGPGLPAMLREVAETAAVDIYGVETGLTESGPDLGSSHFRPLNTPRVAVLADEPARPTSVGPCWFLLDRVYDVPHSLLRVNQLSRETLAEYTVLVFPDDGAGGRRYAARLDSATVAVLRDWVAEGGVFVGLGGGGFFASAGHSGLSSVAQADDPDDLSELTEDEQEETERRRRLETHSQRRQRERLARLPGTIFEVEVDPRHPLGFGYAGRVRVLKIGEHALELGPPGTNAAWFTAAPRVSGYASRQAESHLAERPFLVAEPVGRGHVVMYAEDPNFRLFWYGLTRLFLNSVYFLPSLGE